VEKAVVEQAVVERVAEEKEAKTPVAKTPVAAAPPPRNLLSPVVGWVSGIFAPQSIPASTPAAAQKVQAAEFSTMVSHQVPCFVEAGEEEEAGTEAEVALPGFLSLPPVRRPTLVDSVVGWVSGVFTAKEKLPASFLESALPTKTEFEASLLLPDIDRAKLERDTKAAAETMKAVTLAKAEAAVAKASEDAAATAMQAAVRGHGARSSVAAAAEAVTESYINEVVAGVVASAIDTVSEAEKAAEKAVKPNLLTRLSTMSTSLFAKKTKKAAEGEAEVEVETEKRKSFSPFKKSKKATADVEEQQPMIKFGFKVSESGEVTINMELEKAAAAVA
jgi:hypothetical protein